MQIQVNKTIEETVNVWLPFFSFVPNNEYYALLDENTLVRVTTYTHSGPVVTYDKPYKTDLAKIVQGNPITENEFKAVFNRAIEQLTNIMQPQHGTIILEVP